MQADMQIPDSAPVTPGATRPGRSRTTRLVVAAAVVCLVVAGGVVALAWSPWTDDAPAPGAAAGDGSRALTGIEWQLVSYTVAGRTPALPVGLDSTLRFDGRGGYSGRICNLFAGAAQVAADRVTLAPGRWTEMACLDPIGRVEHDVARIATGSLAWTVAGGRLVLRNATGDSLVYRVRDSVYPDPSGRTVLEGERDGWQYRLAVAGAGLQAAVRDGAGRPWGTSAIGAPSPGEAAMWTVLADRVGSSSLVAGFATPATVRVVHTDGSTAVDLPVREVPGNPWKVFAGFVPEHSSTSRITAYDASGAVVGRWR